MHLRIITVDSDEAKKKKILSIVINCQSEKFCAGLLVILLCQSVGKKAGKFNVRRIKL